MTTIVRRPAQHRSPSLRLDPYRIDEIALTLEEWRVLQVEMAKERHPAGSERRCGHRR